MCGECKTHNFWAPSWLEVLKQRWREFKNMIRNPEWDE